MVIATKAAGQAGPGPNDRGASRHHLLAQIDKSLERLGLDHVDLYQIHTWDPVTPVEETLRGLDDIVRSGRARYIGVSNWSAWQIMKSLGISERAGLERFASVQSYYSLVGRELERELIPMIASEGLGLMVWSPLAGGLLSGKYSLRDGQFVGDVGRRTQFAFPPVEPAQASGALEVLRAVAAGRGVPMSSVALAWLLHQPTVSTVIVGAKRPEQLAENIVACNVDLSAAELDPLGEATQLTPEYPAWMMAVQRSRAGLLSPTRVPG